ncbi:MAG: hypothetical protein J4N92_09345, partial [Chloroflexi bacterium]|nr:hypothetical protein [Chloroflexota bacterium]
MADLSQSPTAYEILGVHSSAPLELISACYWAIAGDLQKKRVAEPEADAELHLLTRVYESISDPDRRAEYNLSVNSAKEPLTKRALPRRRFFLLRPFRRNRYSVKWYVDPHEVLGLHPSAPQSVVPTAYRLMRDVYLRLPPGSRRQETLLDLLDASYAVLGDPQRRAQLHGVRLTEEQESTAPARDAPSVSDLLESTQSDVSEAKVETPVADPATEESPRPPETQVRVPDETVATGEDAPARDGPPVTGIPESKQPETPEAEVAPPVTDVRESAQPETPDAEVALPVTDLRESTQPEPPEAEVSPKIKDDPESREAPRTPRGVQDGPVAAGAGREDGGEGRKAPSAVVALAAAAAGSVARGVRWAALALAALIVVVARFVGRSVRSGWLAASEWIRRAWEERRSEGRAKRVAQDEEFLSRLSSSVEESNVEESKTEPSV